MVKTPQLSVIQERVPSGANEVRHYHEKSEQFFYVLSGVVTLEVDGVEYSLIANQGIHVPAGAPHQLKNDVVFIVTSTPPSHSDRVVM